ncbi:hypothetical protein RBSWK_02101 [Rhodopirellula baltica SWK14]|uniref:Uncharacterized protein n=1 Tax=Rhodopirellula baltica SWK14 TaxID=993516 RepID=L7CJI4_RHOBT|nr:hypothetical protein RBSWK_02101 [Rhodopirellula baltica SWK14]
MQSNCGEQLVLDLMAAHRMSLPPVFMLFELAIAVVSVVWGVGYR